jgi:hypothetical protein
MKGRSSVSDDINARCNALVGKDDKETLRGMTQRIVPIMVAYVMVQLGTIDSLWDLDRARF